MTVHAIFRANVPHSARQLTLLTSASDFMILTRDNPSMLAESLEARSVEEARERLERRFEAYDLDMRRLLAGY